MAPRDGGARPWFAAGCAVVAVLATAGNAAAEEAGVAATTEVTAMLLARAVAYEHGEGVPKDPQKALGLYCVAARAGNPEAQYALATLYKEGRGVAQDLGQAARLLAAAALADNTDAQVEYAIALFNGTGVARDEHAAVALLRKAARKGSPIAQNRLANVLAIGRGVDADPIAAIKWHIVAKTGGISDAWLDDFVQKLPPAERDAAENAAKPWVAAMTQPRS